MTALALILAFKAGLLVAYLVFRRATRANSSWNDAKISVCAAGSLLVELHDHTGKIDGIAWRAFVNAIREVDRIAMADMERSRSGGASQ